MLHSLTRALLLLLCLLYSLLASAGVQPMPMVLRFSQGQSSMDFKIQNSDREKVAYVSLQIEPYHNPKDVKDKDAKSQKTPALTTEESGLLVSPTKLALPPGGSRLIRVRLIEPPGPAERRYVVRVTPVEGDMVPVKTNNEGIRAGVRMIVAYGVVVVIPAVGKTDAAS